MYKNYENRVKSFILDMINPDNKILINDISEKIETSRSKLMNENPPDKKPFIFKGYTTEKDRIGQKLKKISYLHNFHDYDLNNNKKNKYLYLSPIHKDKKNFSCDNSSINNFHKKIPFQKDIKKLIPKVKLERIKDSERKFDATNTKNAKPPKRNIYSQIKSINDFNILNEKNNFSEIINDTKKLFEINNNKLSSPITQKKTFPIKNKNIIKKFYSIPKNNNGFQKTFLKNNNINKENKEMIKTHHNKMHFKAAEEIAENNLDNKNIKKSYLFILPNLLKRNYNLKTKKYSINQDKDCLKKDEKDQKEIDYANFYYRNPLKKIEKYNPELINEVSKIAFKSTKKENKNKVKENKIFNEENNRYNSIRDLNEEYEIQIGGKIFNKINEFNLIANKILKLCKVYNNKSKYNNSYLKVGDGKTMITQGLSINKFEKKYGLNKYI